MIKELNNAFSTALKKRARQRLKEDDQRIERIYYARCNGVQVSVMDIGKVFAAGHAAIAEGPIDDTTLGDRIVAFVETIRKN
jgi:hypothetical protein